MELKGRVRRLDAGLARALVGELRRFVRSGVCSWTISMIPTMEGTLQLE
jgi:hypothetical protein